jgi:hypothetical protein
MTTATQDITERDGLLRAIIEEPFAIELRMMLCDWMQDHDVHSWSMGPTLSALKRQLAHPEQVERLAVEPKSYGGFNQIKLLGRGDPDHAQVGQMTLYFRQGFAFKAYCYWADWDRLGERIVKQQPIVFVQLASGATFKPWKRTITAPNEPWTWWDEAERPQLHPVGTGDLPTCLFGELTAPVEIAPDGRRRRCYPLERMANADLGTACVNLARKRASLPALQWEPLTCEPVGQSEQAEGVR